MGESATATVCTFAARSAMLPAVEAGALIDSGVRALQSLAPAIRAIEGETTVPRDVRRAVERGYFTPVESDRLRAWFARYLTIRSELFETITDLRPMAMPETGTHVDEADRCRAFLVAYAATCLLVRAARHFIGKIATHAIVQRKLNEPSESHRIPRRQYTLIYRSLTHPRNAWQISRAMRFADARRAELESLGDEPGMASVLSALHESEESLRVNVRQYIRARVRYRWHSWRRRRASAVQQAMYALFEVVGRAVADVRYAHRGEDHRVSPDVIAALAELLEPGDVIITRHEYALTNLFLPGYWPHASLHVGTEAQRRGLGIKLDDDRARRWVDPLRILEAKKDGVRFRPLHETLAVDAVAVIRPKLEKGDLVEAIRRAVAHEGKLYNFDFDFFTDEKLVCTEVIYRAFDGVGPIRFELRKRSGRLCLSAEDVLAMAVAGEGFDPLATFAPIPASGNASAGVYELVTGPQSAHVLAASLQSGGPPTGAASEGGDSYNQ